MAYMARALLLCLILITVAVCGCEEDSKDNGQQASPGLRRKIAIPQRPVQPKRQPAQRQSTELAGKSLQGQGEQQVGKTPRKLPEPPPPEKKGLIEPQKSDSLRLAEGFTQKPAFYYDPAGKHDPFESPFEVETEQQIGMAPKKKLVREKRVPLTPLQRIDLSQLKLVAVILAPSGNKALVEDPSGKGYIISQGTYVGQNFGRVKQILKDRVIVEGEVEDFFSGKPKVEITELTLQRKFGDG